MQEITKHKPGTFSWVDLATIGAEDAKKFYTAIFGWEAVDTPAGEDMVYTMLTLNGKPVAALYEMGPEQKKQNLPPHWMSYVTVDNADQILEKAKQLGGSVVMEAADIFDAGRMGVFQDPTGAVLAVWQPKAHIGASYRNVANTLCWNELTTQDTETAKSFFVGLFGWSETTQKMGQVMYTTFMNGEDWAGGMFQPPPEMSQAPPHWLPYFLVEDIKTTVDKSASLGAEVLVPITAAEGVGQFAVLKDPQGAAFGIVQGQSN